MLLGVGVAAAMGATAWYLAAGGPPPRAVPVPPQAQPAAPVPAGPPPILNPLPPPEAAPSLPALEASDALLRELLVALLGAKPFEAMVAPSGIVRRIVATVDNLPRRHAPRRLMPVVDAPGPFRVSGAGEAAAIAPANAARYEVHLRVLEALDARALVAAYVRTYPLFQRAYEELGYPGRYFNDRLIEAIEDLLAAPEPAGPVRLLRPKVLYEYADPDLETRSAGQKILVRMGAENARRAKAKLREIRQALAAAGAGRAPPRIESRR